MTSSHLFFLLFFLRPLDSLGSPFLVSQFVVHRAGLTLRPTSVRTDKSWELLYLPSQCYVRYLPCIPSFWSFRLSLRKGSNPTLTTNAPALCLRPTLETPLTPCPEWTDGQWTLFHVSQKRGTPRVSFPTHDPPYI